MGRQARKGDVREFIKYENRKIYDYQDKTYATMDDLSDLVAKGVKIMVRDDASGEDHTVHTLARIVYDRTRKNKDAFDREELFKILKEEAA